MSPDPTPKSIPSYAVNAVAVAIGIVLGYLLCSEAQKWAVGTLFSTGKYVLTYGDIIALVISGAIMVFGGRIHRLARWIGLGMFAVVLANEIKEATTGASFIV